ncbi:MAG: hypothetical protein R6U95_10260 [Bacteroidales bacterium]
MTKGTKLGIELVLLVCIAFLAYLVYSSVKTNIDFEKEKDRKIELVKNKLINAREFQFAYEKKYGKYCGNWDTLIDFAKNDSLQFDKKIGNLEDSAAVASGEAYVEKVKIPVIEKLKRDSIISTNFNITNLKYVPESDSVFDIGARSINSGGVELSTFQIGVDFNVLLEGMDLQLIANARENYTKRTNYPGIRVGSLEKAITEGNWE